MARSKIYLTKEEVAIFHKNYAYMWKKLNTSPYYVNGAGELPKWIKRPELLPSYVNLSKCMNEEYAPSMNLVNKIVQFYNENIALQINTHQFLYENLELMNDTKNISKSNQTKNLLGLYYGYYYSGNPNDKKIYGMVLKISELDGKLAVQAISGFPSINDMKSLKVKSLFEKKDISYAEYKDFKNTLDLKRSRLTLYKGIVETNHDYINIHAKSVGKKDYLICINCVADQEVFENDFYGGLGSLVFLSEKYGIHFLKIAIGSANNKDIKTFDFEDERLKDILYLKKSLNEHVYFSLRENKAWLEMILAN